MSTWCWEGGWRTWSGSTHCRNCRGTPCEEVSPGHGKACAFILFCWCFMSEEGTEEAWSWSSSVRHFSARVGSHGIWERGRSTTPLIHSRRGRSPASSEGIKVMEGPQLEVLLAPLRTSGDEPKCNQAPQALWCRPWRSLNLVQLLDQLVEKLQLPRRPWYRYHLCHLMAATMTLDLSLLLTMAATPCMWWQRRCRQLPQRQNFHLRRLLLSKVSFLFYSCLSLSKI